MGTQVRNSYAATAASYYNLSETAPATGVIASGFILSGEGDKSLTAATVTLTCPDGSLVTIRDIPVGVLMPLACQNVDIVDAVTSASIVYAYA